MELASCDIELIKISKGLNQSVRFLISNLLPTVTTCNSSVELFNFKKRYVVSVK